MCLISSSPALLGCGVQTLDLPCILAIADVHAAETAVFWYEQKKAVFFTAYISRHIRFAIASSLAKQRLSWGLST
jgi:hypothetical protein